MHLPFTASWTWEPPHTASCNCLPGFLFPFHLVHRCLQPRMGCYPCSEARWKEKNDSLCQSDSDSPSEKKYRSLPSYTLTPTSSSLISRASTVTEVLHPSSPHQHLPQSHCAKTLSPTPPYTLSLDCSWMAPVFFWSRHVKYLCVFYNMRVSVTKIIGGARWGARHDSLLEYHITTIKTRSMSAVQSAVQHHHPPLSN